MEEPKKDKIKSRITTLWLLGAFTSAISTFSFLENIYEFGITDSLVDFIEFYRSMGEWTFGWLGWPFGFTIPSWLIDCWVLSAVGNGIITRVAFHNDFPARPDSHPFWHITTFILLPLSVLTLFGIVIFVMAVFLPMVRFIRRQHGFDETKEESQLAYLTLQEMLTFSFLLLVFFAMNAYGL